MSTGAPLVVRAATQADAPVIAAIYEPYVLNSIASFEEWPPPADEIARRMSARPRLPWLVADSAGEIAGYCYAAHHHVRPAYRWSVNCSVYLAESHRGRGTGRALYEHLLRVLAGLGYVTAIAGIALPNDASVGFHESFGFRRAGTFTGVGFKQGAWRDVGWWQRPLREAPAAPEDPREWSGQL